MQEEILRKLNKQQINLFFNLLKEKNYNQIYEVFGRELYFFTTPLSYKKQDLKKLMEEQNLPEIINKYGSLEFVFVKGLNKKEREYEKKIFKEGRFERYYQEYGEKAFDNNIYKILKRDVQFETGKKVSYQLVQEKRKIKAKKNFKKTIQCMALLPVATLILFNMYQKEYTNIVNQNEIDYSYDLDAYNKKISEYAEEVKSENLSDVEIIMKVMKDMWRVTIYRDNNNMDIIGLLRLDVGQKHFGVCRHMADDYAAKMNLINPDYNARVLAVKINKLESLANIKRHIPEFNETVMEDSGQPENENILEPTNFTGNHAVVLLDVKVNNKKVSLIVDPTNPSIGYLKNGKIKMLSAKDGDGLEYKLLGQVLLDPTLVTSIKKNELESYLTNIDEQVLEEEFGVESQNNAIERLNNKGKIK